MSCHNYVTYKQIEEILESGYRNQRPMTVFALYDALKDQASLNPLPEPPTDPDWGSLNDRDFQDRMDLLPILLHPPVVDVETYSGDAYLGIDAGSTTTKLALIGAEGQLLWTFYAGNQGNPIQTAMTAVARLKEVLPAEADILLAEGWCYLRGKDNAMYAVSLVLTAKDRYYECPVNVRYRYDVCAILPHENNIRLAGFSCRIDKTDLKSGRYRAGILYRHKISGQEFYAESDLFAEV